MNRTKLLDRDFGSLVTVAMMCGVLLFATAASAESLRRSAVVRAVEKARPSVVNITGHKLVAAEDQFTQQRKRVNGMGTGVVVDGRGYVLTNYHVVEGVRRIRVTLANGQAYIARLVAHDPVTDLAIIKIPVRFPMQVIRVGSSRDIMTGETVIAMGNAYGYEHTVTTGIVSAQHRNVQVNDVQSYRDLIQTDASINPGNSGGPLLNIDGDMIGINVAVRVGAQGIGFAIPVDQGMQVAARLMSAERISGVWHGVIHEDQVIGNEPAVVVRNVVPGSPADKAGVRKGDVVRQVAGRRVGRGLDVECALIGTQAGESVAFAIERNDRPVDLRVDLKVKQSSAADTTQQAVLKPLQDLASDDAWGRLGVRVELVSEDEMKRISSRFRGGLRVAATKKDGLAAENGIQKGDVLVGMHVWETLSLDNLSYVLHDGDLEGKDHIPFYVVRNQKTLSGTISVSELRR